MSITALFSVDESTPAIGARVRLMVSDPYLSTYTSGTRGAMGTVTGHANNGAFVRFESDTTPVWVSFEEVAEIVVEVPIDAERTVGLTMAELCDADLRRACFLVEDAAEATLLAAA